jgi:hypothetical protein
MLIFVLQVDGAELAQPLSPLATAVRFGAHQLYLDR